MSLKISLRHAENVGIIDLAGRVTMGEAAGTLRDTIKDLVSKDSKNILLNLDSVSYCEAQIWQDEMSLKVYFAGSANNTPLVFAESDAKELWKYLDNIAEKPV